MESGNDEFQYCYLSAFAFDPIRTSSGAAGCDLKSAYNYVVPKRGKKLVLTDLAFKFPEGCYGRIAPRSGLALKYFIDVGAGVIDADYTGNVGVLLFNHSDVDFEVNRGDRIAQIICEMYKHVTPKRVSKIQCTERGAGGFGSTGLN